MTDARAPRGAQGRIGAAINGKWHIDARIGSGGMATVYAATHRNGHRAALKMLHANLSRDASTRARFLREGYVANAVGHPGVVAVLDDGVAEDGCAFLVLELLEGETVDARRLRQRGKLTMEEAYVMADDALAALAAAHAKGIVHRDVKPENVFLTKNGETKLLDFGLARMKELNTEITQTGVTLGTPEFMPPEQAMGLRDSVDARSDLWALGATLFTSLSGQHVHDAQTVHEQLIASATRRARPIRQVVPALAPALARVIDRALEIEMTDRWQTADEMRAALREARGTLAESRAPEGRGEGRGVLRDVRPRPPPESETIMNAVPLSRGPRGPRSDKDDEPNEDRLATDTTEAFMLPPVSAPAIDFDETHAAPPPVRSSRSPAPSNRPPAPSNRPPAPSNRPPAPSNRPPAPSNRPPAPSNRAVPPPPSASSAFPPGPQVTARMRTKLRPDPPPPPPPATPRRSRPAMEELMPEPIQSGPSSRRSRPGFDEPYATPSAGPGRVASNRALVNRQSYPAPEELADPQATFPPNSLPPPSIQPMNEPVSYGPRYPMQPTQPPSSTSHPPPPSASPISTRVAPPASPLSPGPGPRTATFTSMLYVLFVLVAFSAAMAAYVLSRGSGP